MKVKYYLVLLTIAATHLAGCLTFLPLRAPVTQESYEDNQGTGELGASYGRISGIQVINYAGNDLDLHYTGSNSSGNFFITYHYYVSDRVCLGAAIGAQVLNYNWLDDNSGVAYREKMMMTTGALEVKCLTQDYSDAQFYGLIGVARTDVKERFSDMPVGYVPASNSGLRLNSQFSYGCRFGRTFGGYLELGIGYKGLVNGGLYYKLPGDRAKKKPLHQRAQMD